MNFKKFYLISSIIISLFLFFSGILILNHISTLSTSAHASDGTEGNSAISNIFKPFIIGKDPVNVLFLVGDKSESNTDTMILVNFNPTTDKLSVLSIPRDTRVNLPELKIPKINSLYARKNGQELLVTTASQLLDVDIKYYVYINISTFRQVIDLLGGVTIDVPVDMDYDDPVQNLHIHLKKGRQVLDGKKAEQYLRFRHPNGSYSKEMMKYYDGSDLKRINAQQYFIEELIKQKLNILYVTKLNKIIEVVYDNTETNITLSEVYKLIKNITDFKPENVKMFTLPGDSRQVDGIWYYIYDQSEAYKITKEYFDGKGSFVNTVNNTSSKSKNNSNSNSKSTNTGSTTKKVEQDSTPAKSTTRNNPSNNESSIKGSTTPQP